MNENWYNEKKDKKFLIQNFLEKRDKDTSKEGKRQIELKEN